MSNIVQVVFRAVTDNLKEGFDVVREKVRGTSAEIKSAMSDASAAMQSATDGIQRNLNATAASAEQAGRRVRNAAKEMEDLRKVSSVMDGTVKSLSDLRQADMAAERALKAHMLTQSEYNDFIEASIPIAEALEAGERKLAATVVKGTDAKKAAAVSSRELSRSLSSISVQAVTGQYQGMASATATLGSRYIATSAAAGIMAAAVAAVLAALSLAVYGFIKGQQETEAFNRALSASGNYANTNAQEMRGLAREVAGGTVSITEATGAITKMVASGKVNNEMLRTGAQLAADYARLTGTSMEQAIQKITSLADDPLRAVKEMDGAMHLLTVQQFEYLMKVEETEGKLVAAETALRMLAEASGPRAQQMAEDAGIVERAWNGVKNAVDRAKNAIMDIGRSKSQLEQLQEQLRQVESASGNSQSANPYSGMRYEDRQKMAARLRAEIAALAATEKAAATVEGERNRIQQEGKDAAEWIRQTTLRTDDAARKQEKYNELVRQYVALRKANPQSEQLEGVQFGSDGKPVSGGSFGKALGDIYKDDAPKAPTKGDVRAAERKAEQERREAMRAELTLLQIQRDETDEASAERIKASDAIVANALKNYGADSQQYRSALQQKEADQRAHDARMNQLAMVALDLKTQLADMERDEMLRLADDDYAQGRITAGQLLAIQRQLTNEKLASEMEYYATKKAMAEAAGDTVGAAQAAAAMEVATADAAVRMRGYENEFQQNSITQWQAWGDAVAGAVGNTASAMIFQGMRWRDGFRNILGSLLQSFIGFTTQKLARWITGEAAQTAATVAGNAIRVTSDKAAAKESIIANAGAVIKKIIANAAEVFTSVYKAIAGIPYVGPFLAPAMAVAAGAVVVGMVSKVASAERGWERVPADGMITELHKDEQVLPAEYAEGLRGLVQQGGQQGGTSITIHAIDGKSVERWARRNGGQLVSGLSSQLGNTRSGG